MVVLWAQPAWLLLAQVTPLIARSKPLSLSPQQSPRLVTSTRVICSGLAIGVVTRHHGAFSSAVCVQLDEPQLGLVLPSMARVEYPPLLVELCVVDAPVIDTTDGDGDAEGGGQTPGGRSEGTRDTSGGGEQ